jgi:tRNA(Ile)-lysidine synthase
MQSERRPRLSPAIADIRRAVRASLSEHIAPGETRLVLVGLSGGADSLALASATAFEAPRAGLRAGAVIINHNLQAGSARQADAAATQARELGLDPVLVQSVNVGGASGAGAGPEADARTARYAAFQRVLQDTGASHLLLGHTLDDQAETVLLGLARGSGPVSLRGMAGASGPYLRPMLGIRRVLTRQFCLDAGLDRWDDPQNLDPAYARVRVRETVLPVMENELGPGIAEALVRTADQLREDSDALDHLAGQLLAAFRSFGEDPAGTLSVEDLASQPSALQNRVIRLLVADEFGITLERTHTLAVARLLTNWSGQKALDLPGVRVIRQNGKLIFSDSGHAPSKGTTSSHGTPRH